MLRIEHGVRETSRHEYASDFLVADNVFFFAQRPKNKPSAFLKNAHERLVSSSPPTLEKLRQIVHGALNETVGDKDIDGAFGVLTEDIVYLITTGKARVLLKRGEQCATLISGQNTASGKIHVGDVILCTADEEVTADLLKQKLDNFTPQEAAARFDTEGVLIVRFATEKPVTHTPRYRGKKLTIVAIIVLTAILVWSVGFGVKRRTEALLKKETAAYVEKITDNLAKAQESELEEVEQSLLLIDKAKKDLAELKKKAGKRQLREIADVSAQIKRTEQIILKKEEKKYEEFYDLTLIEKDGQGDILTVDQDDLAVLDISRGVVYIVSLSKKSTVTIKKDDLREARLIAVYNNQLYVYKKGAGVSLVNKDKKMTIAVPDDKEWGYIRSLSVYNGNIYLLDAGVDEIYKYLAAEKGFSAKSSYFKQSQSIDLEGAHSIAIDSSMYIGAQTTVYKYTAGNRDRFAFTVPGQGEPLFDKVFTDKTVRKVYLWDKKQGKIYIVSKEGVFEKQIVSNILTQASDFMVREKNPDHPAISAGIFVLVKEKIYRIEIE